MNGGRGGGLLKYIDQETIQDGGGGVDIGSGGGGSGGDTKNKKEGRPPPRPKPREPADRKHMMPNGTHAQSCLPLPTMGAGEEAGRRLPGAAFPCRILSASPVRAGPSSAGR
jgi:hypothetical protein